MRLICKSGFYLIVGVNLGPGLEVQVKALLLHGGGAALTLGDPKPLHRGANPGTHAVI